MEFGTKKGSWSRRSFLKLSAAGFSSVLLHPLRRLLGAGPTANSFPDGRFIGIDPRATDHSGLFSITDMPDQPFADPANPNHHAGVEALLALMSLTGNMFYQRADLAPLEGPMGLIAPDDVVLIKVNAQWKYRGCTNSDLVRGLIQRVLDHPDGFRGEVVMVENGQGRGSLACDTYKAYAKDHGVHANANDESQSFVALAEKVFKDPRVSTKLLDPIRTNFLAADDHVQDGYRKMGFVSYPCFTTAGGRRVELREGVWNGSGYGTNLKLINVPVLKHHDQKGAEITASLKHFYGLVSMSDGNIKYRHYTQLGETTGTMISRVRTPSLNIIDATWVSFGSISGFPASATFRANRIVASQDPVALDYWAAKNILYPIDANPRHSPDFPGIDAWLTQAQDTINGNGGLFQPDRGIFVDKVTKDESKMDLFSDSAARFLRDGPLPFPVIPGQRGRTTGPATARRI